MKERKFSAIFLLLLLSVSTNAQEMWGIANSNYAGNMGMHLNPASMVGAPYKYEINLIAADAFFDNNYVYWKSMPALINGERAFDFYTSSSKHAYLSGYALGPSFILNKGNQSFGIHTAFRSIASANDINVDLAKTFFEDFHYLPQHRVLYSDQRLQSAGLMFGELGLSYGATILENEKHWLGWGVTLSGIVAFSGAYVHGSFEGYSVLDSSTLAVVNADLDYAHAPTAGENPKLLRVRGFGADADAGIIYIHKRFPSAYKCDRDADKAKRYQYKIGLSLIDLGYVGFSKDASRLKLESGSTVWYGIDTLDIKSLENLDYMISTQFEGSPTATLEANKFGMYTPAAISLQFDYCFKPRWYVNLSAVQRWPLSYREVWRANQVALVPRYEMRRFEASVSAHLYEYEYLAMGAAVRYGIFVLGSDRLLSFFSNRVRSFDLFFGLKWNSCSQNSKKTGTGMCPFD